MYFYENCLNFYIFGLAKTIAFYTLNLAVPFNASTIFYNVHFSLVKY